MKALALCHNVTPVRKKDEMNGELSQENDSVDDDVDQMERGSLEEIDEQITYQAASPDEVRFCHHVSNSYSAYF